MYEYLLSALHNDETLKQFDDLGSQLQVDIKVGYVLDQQVHRVHLLALHQMLETLQQGQTLPIVAKYVEESLHNSSCIPDAFVVDHQA